MLNQIISIADFKKELEIWRNKTILSSDKEKIDELADAIDEYEEILADLKNLQCQEDAKNTIEDLLKVKDVFKGYSIVKVIDIRIKDIKEKLPALKLCKDPVTERIKVLEKHAPKCTKCAKSMIIREGNGSYFWGCPDFPECWGKRWLTKEEEQWLYEGMRPELSSKPSDPKVRTKKKKSKEEDIEIGKGDMSNEEIIELLAQGVNPITGEILPGDSVINSLEISRALFEARDALKNYKTKVKKDLPANAGQSWSNEDDQMLINDYEIGMTIVELSKKYQRTRGAITSRLKKLKLIDP